MKVSLSCWVQQNWIHAFCSLLINFLISSWKLPNYICRSRKVNCPLQRRRSTHLEEGKKRLREKVHPSLERCHNNCLNLTIWCGIPTKVSGLGMTGCICSWGYFSAIRKGNHVRVALLAPKSFQCKRALCSCGSTALRWGIEHGKIQLHGTDDRELEKSFCSFCLTLACSTGCNTSVHHQQVWSCLCLHWGWAGPEPFRQALGRMESFRLHWTWPKDSGTHLKR